jgi:hypothetical protein
MGLTNFPNGLSSFGIPVLPPAGVIATGRVFFVAPGAANASDGNRGDTLTAPLATLYKAHSLMTSGNNDVCYLVGNGATSGTARLSLALAQGVDSTASTGTLNWTKNACHLIGIAAPSNVAQRARIAPPSGTYTQATFGSGNLVVVTGSGCLFSNFSLFHGFSTGGTNQICWTDNGSRNAYTNVNFGGIADAASAADTGARSLKIGSAGSGENAFYNCTIGLDTVTRSAANASLELAGATPRNSFQNCLFPFQGSAAGVLGILGTGADCLDRWNLFNGCSFVNNIKSSSTQMTVLASLTNAATGGLLEFKNCTLIGITKFGDTIALANSYVDGGPPAAATTGLAVNPS